MAGVLQKTTGLTGHAASKHLAKLQLVYNRILQLCNKLPQDYIYRKSVENLVKERSNILMQNQDIAVVEEKIGNGKIDQIMADAMDELSLVQCILQQKSWENLMEKAPAHQWTWPPHK
ncbi:Probable NADH dehydrogenase [ubiquinone] 1 alpha subcomplex subunit 5 [Anthophora plagiata]